MVAPGNSLKPVQVLSLEDNDDEDMELDNDAEDDDTCPFEPMPMLEDHPRTAYLRAQASKRAWSQCESDMREILGGLYDSTVKQIAAFVRTADAHNRSKHGIPTALILGATPMLSGTIMGALQAELSRTASENGMNAEDEQSNPTSAILARISSRDCPNKKAALKSVIGAVIASEESQDDIVQKKTGGRKPSLMAGDDIAVLHAWFRSRYQDSDPAERPRIALYLEDFEAFDPSVLSDLLYIINSNRQQLPFILLFAISTSEDAINTLLPRRSIELLRTVAFTATQSSETFYSLMYQTFIERTQPLTPGYRVLSHLRTTFLQYNQSIDAVISKLQYMYMAFFYSQPHALFCLPLPDVEAYDTEAFTAAASSLRLLTSYADMVDYELDLAGRDARSIQKLQACLSEDSALFSSVKNADTLRENYAAGLREAWQLYRLLQEFFGTSISDELMFTEYLSGKLPKRAERIGSNLRQSSDQKCLACLEMLSDDAPHLSDLSQPWLRKKRDELEALCRTGERQAGRNTFVNGNVIGGKPKTKGDIAYTSFISRFSNEIEDYLKNAFRHYSQLNFHELWYHDDYKLLQKTFHPAILPDLRYSLQSPWSRLPRHLLEERREPLLKAAELDICHAQNLLSDAGKLVNLGDWYSAFQLAVSERPGADEEEESTVSAKKRRTNTSPIKRKSRRRQDSDASEDEVDTDEPRSTATHQEARFLQSVADLAYLGFIQPSKRKVEHVARIVF